MTTFAAPRLFVVSISATSLLASGCDLLDSATATTVVGGLVVATPALSVPDRIEVPDEVVATAWVGDRDSATSTDAPRPIGDASVRLSFANDEIAVPVRSASTGLYSQTSLMDPRLTYAGAVPYTLEANIDGARFGGRVTAPPRLTPASLSLSPEPSMTADGLPEVGVHPASTALTLSWGDQFGRYAYVTVLRADPDDPDNPEQVFDNRPRSTSEILSFIVGSPPTEQTIPADIFASDGLYAVILVAANNTDDLLPGTFLGSPILMGSGAAVFLAVGRI